MPRPCKPLLNRLANKFTIDDGCWEWTAYRAHSGYGRISRGRKEEGAIPAHRAVYELLVGAIPAGMQLDHLCRNRGCVRPSHLEPVTCRENLLRGDTAAARCAAQTHCKRGHLFDNANTYMAKAGSRVCRTCNREWWRAHAKKGE